MNKYILAFFLISSSFAIIPEGSLMFNTDLSYTSARDLWKGDGHEHIFSEDNGNTRLHGKTSYWNLGLTGTYGLPWTSEVDVRLAYTKSEINNADHPNQNSGQAGKGVSQLSEISLKWKKHLLTTKKYSVGGYVGFKHPIEDTPENPSFVAVNDFSTHIDLGTYIETQLSKKVGANLDLKYRFRSEADKLKSLNLPADQMAVDLTLPYAHSDRMSLGAGLSWLHTMSGPDISSTAFVEARTAIGATPAIPPFFAARERFLGYSMFMSYYNSNNTWVGLSRFKKFWGRNTDRSRTWTVFYGFLY